MQSCGQGKLEPSTDPELVRAESWGHDPHLHFLYLSFPEPPPSTVSNMATVAVLVVLGAAIVTGAVVAFVMKMRRRNTGRKGQSLSFLSASFRVCSAHQWGTQAHPTLLLSLTGSAVSSGNFLVSRSSWNSHSFSSHRWTRRGLCSGSKLVCGAGLS